MSRDDRDQRGGHPNRKSDWLSCECCPNLPRHPRNRTSRNRELDRYERNAEGA